MTQVLARLCTHPNDMGTSNIHSMIIAKQHQLFMSWANEKSRIGDCVRSKGKGGRMLTILQHRKRSKQQLTNRFREGVLLIQNARVRVPTSSGAITNVTSKN